MSADLIARLRGPAQEAASRLIAGAFRRDREDLPNDRRPRFSIPAQPDTDDDLVVAAILREAASALEAAEARIASVRAESVEECARVAERMADEQEYRNRKYPRHFKSYPSWAHYPWHYRQAATAIRALIPAPPAPKQEGA